MTGFQARTYQKTLRRPEDNRDWRDHLSVAADRDWRAAGPGNPNRPGRRRGSERMDTR